MAGIRIRPRAATVAGPEPEIAAKKQATSTQTMATPPLKWPTQAWASLMSRVEMPDFSMMFPPRMKKGIAIRTDLVMAAETSCGTVPSTMFSGRPAPRATMAATLDMPRQTAMGAPISSKTANRPNRTIVTMLYSPFPAFSKLSRSSSGTSLRASASASASTSSRAASLFCSAWISSSTKRSSRKKAPSGTKEP